MEEMSKNKMGSAPMLALILSMSLPAMFSMLVQALYNVVDSYFVAKLGVEALTAVSLAFPIQNLMIAIGVGTGVGINSLVSRRLGEGRVEEANRAATHGIMLGALSGLAVALLGIFGTSLFFRSFTSNPLIYQMGCDYVYVVTICSFGMFIQINMEKTLQSTGSMIIPMFSQLIGAVTNIILDPIMIFGLFGFPKMGVRGAAVATVAGQILGMIFVVIMGLAKNHAVNISLKGFKFNAKTIKDIYAVGFPSIIMQSIGSVMTMGINAILITFSDVAVAIFGIYFKLQSFVFMPVFGLTHGVMPIMGYNYGARNKKRLMDALKIGLVIALTIMAAGTALFFMAPEQLLMIFDANAEMLQIGIPALRTIALCFIPAALGIMFSTLFQAVGMGGRSLLISILRQLVLILPLAYFLSKLGLNFVWYAFPLAETVSFTASLVIFSLLYRKHIKNLQPLSGETPAAEA
ncbi:MATE family efflux transporter [Hydrogenoanaerobacterium sp.]|uniref:MATE family efflux transporter n=1 Tax=Hydrogenoanaerobacterium sp. TaxID=2953763 RepID=UPI00289C0E88|nr:MATE family efflux transporter [Hydrogenoanaerobacterium sp.]